MARIAITKEKMPVRVRRAGDDEWTGACVMLASSNADSLALALDGGVRASKGFVFNMLPLLYDEKRGAYFGVFIPDKYELEAINQGDDDDGERRRQRSTQAGGSHERCEGG
jgi:hypothetical protein